MTLHILLDSTPLGLLSTPVRGMVVPIADWASACLAAGHEIYVPEVIDYELRRELLRAGKANSVRELDRLKSAFHFLPINSAAMLLAADLWATSRQSGVPASDLMVATSNVGHLSRFVPADLWSNIKL